MAVSSRSATHESQNGSSQGVEGDLRSSLVEMPDKESLIEEVYEVRCVAPGGRDSGT